MSRTSFAHWPCTMARTIDVVGDKWTLLILREAFFLGGRRFADFEDALTIPTNVLTSRLGDLVEAGVLLKSYNPVGRSRHEYLPTAKGAELFPVLAAIVGWGNRWVTDDRLQEQPLNHRACGGQINLDRCTRCGSRVGLEDVEIDRVAFLAVNVDLLCRYGRDGFAAEHDRERAGAVLRKLRRVGYLDADELLTAVRAHRMTRAAVAELSTLITAL